MRNEKIIEIQKNINCHKGRETLNEVWALLPLSCENCTRRQIIDILNATQTAFANGKKETENEISSVIGNDITTTKNKLEYFCYHNKNLTSTQHTIILETLDLLMLLEKIVK